MVNPFESLDARLSRIEALMTELNRTQPQAVPAGETQYGNFGWYITETGEANSTARQRIARGEVPGITKLGKRLLFDKAIIRGWIKDNQRKTDAQLMHLADESFNRQHSRQNKSRGTV